MGNSLTNLHISSPLNILIVEDENIVALDLKSILTYLGYKIVGITGYGEEAVSLVRTLKPDAVVMDIGLRGEMDGVEAARTIRDEMSTPVVFITANADAATLNRAKITEPYGFILKPFDEREIQTTLEMAFFRYKTDQELRESRQWLATTLQSIGDAVIATDEQGNVKFMNSIAESLTGWTQAEATGKALPEIFTIVNDATRKTVVNPVDIVLREGRIVGLANHTVLISKSGKEYNIDDAAAPIYNRAKDSIIGVVLTFRDITEKYRVEAALEASEKRFRAFIENSDDMVRMVDGNGEVLYISPSVERITGYSYEESVHQQMFELIHPDDLPIAKQKLEALRENPDVPVYVQHRIKHKDGEWIWVEGTVANLLKDKTIGAIVSNIRDITARKQAEQAVEESYALLKAVTEGTDDIIFVKDIAGKYLLVNSRGKKISGFEPNQMIGKTDIELFSVETANQSMAADKVVIETQTSRIVENTVQVEGGKQVYMTSKSALFDKNGKVMGVVGVARDITQLKEAQNEIRKNEELFRAMIEDSNNGVVLINKEGKIIYTSPSNEKILGYSPQERLEQSFTDMIHPNDKNKVVEFFKEISGAKKKLEPFEIQALHKDGVWRWLEVSAQNMLNNPSVNAIVVNFHDITRRTVAAEKLAKSEQNLNDIVEAITVPMIITSIERNEIIYGNQLVADMVGYSLEDLYSLKTVDFYVNPQDRERAVAELTEKGFIKNLIVKFRRKNGEEYWAIITSRFIVFGGEQSVVTTMYDITEQKKAEEELLKSNERFEMIAKATDDVIWDWSLEDNSIWWNDNFYSHLGYKKRTETLNIDSWLKGLHPLDKERVSAGIYKAIDSGHNFWADEYRFLKADGTEVFVLDRGYILRNNEGKPYRMVGAMVDITDHKSAEEVIKKNEEKYRLMFDHNPQPMWIYDSISLKFLEVNEAATLHYGYSREEFLSMTILDIRPESEIPLLMENLSQPVNKYNDSGEWHHLKKNGEVINVQITSHIIEHNNTPARHVLVNDITNRKKTESALQENYVLLKTITEGIHESIFAKDTNGIYTFINSTAAETINKKKEEVIGFDDTALFSPEHAAWLKEIDKDIMSTGKSKTFEGYMTEGFHYQFADTRYPLFDVNTNEVVGVVGISRDITERKKAEEKLRLYERALQNVGEGVVIIDAEHEEYPTIFANDAFCTMTGYSTDEVLGRNRDFLKGQRSSEAVESEMRQSIVRKIDFNGEAVNYKKDGTPFWNYVRISPMPDDNGKVTHFIGLHTDIDERKKTEEKLRLYERALQSAAEGIVITDTEQEDCPIIFINDGFNEITGYTTEEVLGKNCRFLQGVDTDSSLVNEINKCIAERSYFEGEILNYKKNGTPFWNFLRIAPVHNEFENVTHFVGFQNDITERKLNEDLIRSSQKQLAEAQRLAKYGNWNYDCISEKISWSDELFNVFGVNPTIPSQAEISFISLIHEADREMVEQANNKARLSGEPYAIEYRIVTPNGEERIIEELGRGELNAKGTVIRLFGTAQDITERRKAEEKIKESEEKYRSLVENSPDIIITLDKQNSIQFINHTIPGMVKEQVIGLSAFNFINPKYHQLAKDTFEKVYEIGEVQSYEVEGPGINGTVAWYITHAGPIFSHNEVVGITLVTRDITARKLSEEQLRKSEKNLRDIVEAITVPMVVTSMKEGKVIYANQLLADMLDVPMEVALNQQAVDYYKDPDDRTIVIGLIKKHGFLRNYLLQLRRKSGELIWVLFSGGIVTFDGEQAVVVTMYDISEQKKAEEKLRESEELFRAMIENSADGVTLIDSAGKLTYMSPNGEKIIGTDVEELNELGFITFIHPNDREEVNKKFEMLLAGKEFERTDVRWNFKGKQWKWVQTQGSNLIHNPSIGSIIMNFREVTDQKKADEEIILSKARLGGVIESAMDAIITIDENYNIVLFNKAAEKMFGFNPDEVVGTRVDRFIPERFHKKHSQFIAEFGVSGITNRAMGHLGVLSGIRANGDEFPIEASISQIDSIAGKLFTVILRDVTERRKAEQQLQDQAALLEIVPDAIIMRELSGKVLYWNSGATKLYGWTAAEAIGKSVLDLISNREGTSFFEMQKILIEKGEWSGEFVQITKEKQKILVQSRWKLVRNSEGEPTSVLVTNTDITEKRNLEQQFLRAQRLESIGTLASGIAHDLNNILTPVVLGLELVKTRLDDEPGRQRIDSIIGIVKRGSGLISQVLDFARGTKGENVPINPKYIVAEIAKVIRETFPRNIDININITKDDLTVIGDGTQIHQVLMNLCINARDAMQKGGKLDIEVALQTTDDSIVRQNINAKIGKYVVITVRDSGEGIPAEIKDRIFDPFFTTKAEGKGTGLGLATVFTIVKNHGGFINLYSEVGNGTTFKIYIPAHITTDTKVTEEEYSPRNAGKQEVVLVVDDEELIRTISRDILIENGYNVITAQNGAEAAEIYKEKSGEISLILTDVMMPVMNGVELIEIVRSINPGARIVAASGLMQGEIAAKLAQAKVSARLSKPFTADKLLAAVHQALEV